MTGISPTSLTKKAACALVFDLILRTCFESGLVLHQIATQLIKLALALGRHVVNAPHQLRKKIALCHELPHGCPLLSLVMPSLERHERLSLQAKAFTQPPRDGELITTSAQRCDCLWRHLSTGSRICKKLKSIEGFRNADIGYARKASESFKQIACTANLHFVSVAIQKSCDFALKVRIRVPNSFGGAHKRSVIRLI
ncbi:hypothetical protein [Pseudomonas sp. PMCC200344]|uniref:hypothetical protein n=1 Tax=Pseudomonas sp. PMCC200344 TaxID=3042028 RepID=UPI0024B378F3|nr:hypothetical protein [Pseudomonas sp. PMCC200344]